ncbi:MAG: hypothetical protein JNL13_09480, partial [Chitinophagaceae bacterium]|nr:hypothetical protein [Chitinophagaceae bacterium]
MKTKTTFNSLETMKHLFITLFTLLALPSFAQNLVPNGDFEAYTHCPNSGGGRISECQYWFNASLGTPDYFLPCGEDAFSHAPDNFFGYQKARSGDGYAGMYLFQATRLVPPVNYREYLTVKLTSELKPGKKYDFEMYVSL